MEAGRLPALLLVVDAPLDPATRALLSLAAQHEIPTRVESVREMRRMAPSPKAGALVEAPSPPEVIAFFGPDPNADLKELMARPGLVVGLCGLRYPGNVGFIFRSVEVAGAAGVVLDANWDDSQMEEALRVGMRPERFMPVVRSDSSALLVAARTAGRRILAVETSGATTPWETDWQRPSLLLVGSETEGLPRAVLEECDASVRIPTRGFIPSYNVQAAVGICLGEWLRQDDAGGS